MVVIKMILLVDILLLNLPVHTCNGDLFVTSDFTRQPRLDDVYLPTIHLRSAYKTASLLICIIDCKSYPGCLSVRYHVVREECHLLDACLMCNIGEMDIGWRHFCKDPAPVIIPDTDFYSGHIAFQASSDDRIPARGEVLIFDKILANLGHGYNSTSGIFSAPREGFFIFSWSQQSRRINTYTKAWLFVEGQQKGKLHDKGGNVVTNFAMVHLKMRDQVYVCSYYKNSYVDTLSQFSGWIYEKPTDSCDINFHGTAVNRNNETIVYKSHTPPDEIHSRLTSGSNGTVVIMSLTTVNRGLFSNLRYVIDGVDVMTSVIDGWRSRDVAVTLIAVQHIYGNSSIEVRNEKTHINSAGNTLTAVCISKVPAFNVWASDPEQATDRTVVFTKVLLNEGDMFNASDGTIHSQRKGLYFMTWTVHSFNNTTILSSLVVNGTSIRHLKMTSLPDHHTVSTSVAVHQLEEKDKVEIRIVEGETGDRGVYFSGIMIAALD